MSNKKPSKFGRLWASFAGFLLFIGLFIGVGSTGLVTDVYAVPGEDDDTIEITQPTTEINNDENEDSTNEEDGEEGEEENNNEADSSEDEESGAVSGTSSDTCKTSLGAIGWLVCPTTGKIAEAVDWLYRKIEDLLVIQPISAEDGSPIYEIWKYCLGMTNIVFIIFLLVVIYSQITGIGISNYGIKKSLPKLIIAAVLVNLSFLICLLAVDVSNILGSSLRGLFVSVEESTMASSTEAISTVSYADLYSAFAGGTGLAIGGAVVAFEAGAIWMLIPVILGAIVAVATGLITIALRQAVVTLLVMISPLAMVAYVLPNTEKWFRKWKDLLFKMLVFYPMFSLLFGASSLAGFAIIASAKDGFWLLLGVAVQIFPLFFSWSLMKMSGTFLGNINTKMRGIASRPVAASRGMAQTMKMSDRQKNLAKDRPITPSLRLMQFMTDRSIEREANMTTNRETIKTRAMARRAQRNWRGSGATGAPTKRGEREYARVAQDLENMRIIERDKNTMNKGLGYLATNPTQKVRLDQLDDRIVAASDLLKIEQARGEKIEYENAKGFHSRMEAAINAHMDDIKGFEYEKNENGEMVKVPKRSYKFHLDPNDLTKTSDMVRYNAMRQIMEGSVEDVHFAAATAAQGYDTQKKIVETKMQKYFEMAPPTIDVVNRLSEMTTLGDSAKYIDSIIPGLRILNQRGDTDLVKKQLDNLLDKEIGGGIELGSHASQALASFLMFEVKDGDPYLRRFGKYINLETARAYNKNDRQVMNVTYDEYVRGYHDGEDERVNPNGRMFAKKGMKQLVEGTSLDNIERTALANLDDSLKRAYGFSKGGGTWDIDGYLKKREEIQTAFEPAFLSASLKWMSGSEQINSGVKFWTGYELAQKMEEVEVDGEKRKRPVLDEKKKPIYEWKPVWEDEDNGFAGHEEEVQKYFRRKTRDYFKDQTTGQILGMRTDYRDPTVEHLIEMYMEEGGSDEENAARRREYDEALADIQTRYGDEEDAAKAQEKRNADITRLKREFAGRELRSILDSTGKLEQIYTTRRSGSANNAEDWLRKMLSLDNKDEIYKYLDAKDKKRKREKPQRTSGEVTGDVAVPDDGSQTRIMAELRRIFDRAGDSADPDEEFYRRSHEKMVKEFGEESSVVGFYEEYKKNNSKANKGELWDKIEEILSEYFTEE